MTLSTRASFLRAAVAGGTSAFVIGCSSDPSFVLNKNGIYTQGENTRLARLAAAVGVSSIISADGKSFLFVDPSMARPPTLKVGNPLSPACTEVPQSRTPTRSRYDYCTDTSPAPDGMPVDTLKTICVETARTTLPTAPNSTAQFSSYNYSGENYDGPPLYAHSPYYGAPANKFIACAGAPRVKMDWYRLPPIFSELPA